jgi:tetratricopeptide (TPR) repeat protein
MIDNDQNIQNDAPNQGRANVQGDNHGQNVGANTGTVSQYNQQGQSVGRDEYNIGGDAHFHGKQAPTPHQLRAPVADFVGREQEIAELRQALTAGDQAAAICGVRGMGGIGKTELAMVVANQLAEQFPDGQIVVELFGASNPLTPERAVQEAIRAFDREAKLPDDLPSLQALYRQHCSGKRLLVLADDAKDEAQVRPLLPPAGCALLVTSRSRIELEGMQTHALGTLSPAEAETLLLQICPRIGDDVPDLAKLCGYLPLALRVSATFLKRRPTRPVAAYLQNLRDEQARLAHLHDPKDPKLNVEASLALSYNALPADVQQAFAQLGVFVGSFALEAAEAVITRTIENSRNTKGMVGWFRSLFSGNPQIKISDLRSIDELLEEVSLASLVEYDTVSERYELHDLVQAFALARLEEQGDQRPARMRHALYYVVIANHANYRLYDRGMPREGLALFDRERRQIDAGWQWVREQPFDDDTDLLLLDFADATAPVGDLRYDVRREWIPQLEAQRDAARRLGERQYEGHALGNLGIAYAALGEHQRAIGYHKQSLAIKRAISDRRGEGTALRNLGVAYNDLGEYQRAIDYYDQALAIACEIGDQDCEGSALCNLGVAYNDLGEYQQAIGYHEQALAIAREIGSRRGESAVLNNLGIAYAALGEVPRAIAYYEQALAIARELGDQRGEAHALGNLGIAYAALGEVLRAIAYYEQRLDVGQEIGDVQGVAITSWNLGELYEEQGDLARAVGLMQVYVDFEQQIGHADAEQDVARLEEVKRKLREQST